MTVLFMAAATVASVPARAAAATNGDVLSGANEGPGSSVTLVGSGKGRQVTVGTSPVSMRAGSKVSVSGNATGSMQFGDGDSCDLLAVSAAEEGKVVSRVAGFLALLRGGMLGCTIKGDAQSTGVSACVFQAKMPSVWVSANVALDTQLFLTCDQDPLFEVAVLSGEALVVAPDGKTVTVAAGYEVSCDPSSCEPVPRPAVFSTQQLDIFAAQSSTTAVASVSPNSGPSGGGEPVTIMGTGFIQEGVSVKFGPNLATGVQVLSPTEIQATSPAGAGTVDVVVTDTNGTSPTTPLDRFAYSAPSAPPADQSYPDGAIVNYSGAYYVFAGGHAFEVQGPAELAALEQHDQATVLDAPSESSPPDNAPRAGTLLSALGTGQLYVVGADGELHGFATVAQLVADGYDQSLEVTVTSLGGLTVGSTAGVLGSGANALATAADGAIVDSSGTYYVFAGGRAFGIPTAAALATVQAADNAEVLVGTVAGAETTETVASGELLNRSGTLYVSFEGQLWPFQSQAQLDADGYLSALAVPVPNTGGMPIANGGGG